MKRTINIYTGLLAMLFVIAAGCTKLKSTSYNQIIGSEFVPGTTDLAALSGAAYVDWRGLLLQWNTLYRAQEVSGD